MKSKFFIITILIGAFFCSTNIHAETKKASSEVFSRQFSSGTADCPSVIKKYNQWLIDNPFAYPINKNYNLLEKNQDGKKSCTETLGVLYHLGNQKRQK